MNDERAQHSLDLDRADEALRCGDRLVEEVAAANGWSEEYADKILSDLADESRALRTYFGGYVPLNPGDVAHLDAEGRIIGAKQGRL